MRRTLTMLAVGALTMSACSGDDALPPPDIGNGPVTTSSEPPPPTAPRTTTTTPSTTTTTTGAPTTTVDTAAILAAAEAAYLEAFEVSKQIIREPLDPDNNQLIRDHFTGPNLENTVEALRLTVDGNYVARINDENPTFARIVEPAEFLDGDPNLVRVTVCEFDSDRLYTVRDAPDGGDSLVRDEPISILIVVRMSLEDGRWKSMSGTRIEDVSDEAERCSTIP